MRHLRKTQATQSNAEEREILDMPIFTGLKRVTYLNIKRRALLPGPISEERDSNGERRSLPLCVTYLITLREQVTQRRNKGPKKDLKDRFSWVWEEFKKWPQIPSISTYWKDFKYTQLARIRRLRG